MLPPPACPRGCKWRRRLWEGSACSRSQLVRRNNSKLIKPIARTAPAVPPSLPSWGKRAGMSQWARIWGAFPRHGTMPLAPSSGCPIQWGWRSCMGLFWGFGWDGGGQKRHGLEESCAVLCCAHPTRAHAAEMGMWGRVLLLSRRRMDGVAKQLPGAEEAGTKQELPGPPYPIPPSLGGQWGQPLCPHVFCHHPTPQPQVCRA